ncbi:hypothetical protein A6R68_00701 [Neotoma lepida]|uniref:G-protein coupled receptors family 2 profile 2 domain-containing protein n=1 Tax=Neotoma lepida TaxID=56216 RepID=A0A1A6GWP0_NEOLE|nr:hypothetical protein A6R68_00701 [Neotoma lepida]
MSVQCSVSPPSLPGGTGFLKSVPAGALPRLCDVLRVLQEERAQCLQELSREKTGDLGLETVSGIPGSAPSPLRPEGGAELAEQAPVGVHLIYYHRVSLWGRRFTPRPCLLGAGLVPRLHAYLLKLKVMYTVGYSSSLAMLLVALSILCSFRRLHCTRNYIHMHLFVSFILRALSNFIKDAVLFPSDDVTYCDARKVGCKLVMVFFQYCILANYAWLLVEGLYLHTLLAISFFSERTCLQVFVLLGWGMSVQSVYMLGHQLQHFHLVAHSGACDSVHPGERLAKSTLLLIPLFGIHYIVFAFSPEDAMEGLVVAILYCFLNGEVQLEVQKKWHQWHLQEFPLRPVALSNSFSNASSGPTHSTKASTSEQSRSTPRASVI